MRNVSIIVAIAALHASPAGADSAALSAARHPQALQGAPAAARAEPWRDGAVYRLITAPGRVTDIALQPGETLIAVAAGDTAQWIIGDTASGAGVNRRTHILVKPVAAGLRTNMIVTTDRRVYHLELETGPRPMTSLSWTYPPDELLALRTKPSGREAAPPVAVPVAVERLNFGYSIAGDSPPWRPLRAFDDGRQVFIEFPPSLETGEAPPLFLIGASGDPELVNYRQRGRYYVVDRLFEAAELRLGGPRQIIVRITRDDRTARRHGRSS